MVAMPPAEVGLRVRIEAKVATVRYVGNVEGQAGQWVGLEWDTETRGKHDGCVAGHRYFTCKGQSGSFIRLQKFQQLAEFGKTVLEALQERYQAAILPDEEANLAIKTISSKQLAVKLVGRAQVQAKQGRLERLEAANLAGATVSAVVSAAQSFLSLLSGRCSSGHSCDP